MIANIITVSRMLLSVLLLGFSPSSYLFAVLYILCGITDMLDGFVARKLHTESEKGARLDSTADLIFSVVYVVKILPVLNIPIWIWVWIAAIAVIKITGIILKSRRKHKLLIEHSVLNKLTGIMLFLLPISVCIVNTKYGAVIVCAVATAAVIEEIIRLKEEMDEQI